MAPRETASNNTNNMSHCAARQQSSHPVFSKRKPRIRIRSLDTLSHSNSLRITSTTPTSRPGLDHHPVKFTPHPRRVEQGTLLSPSQLCVQAWTPAPFCGVGLGLHARPPLVPPSTLATSNRPTQTPRACTPQLKHSQHHDGDRLVCIVLSRLKTSCDVLQIASWRILSGV